VRSTVIVNYNTEMGVKLFFYLLPRSAHLRIEKQLALKCLLTDDYFPYIVVDVYHHGFTLSAPANPLAFLVSESTASLKPVPRAVAKEPPAPMCTPAT